MSCLPGLSLVPRPQNYASVIRFGSCGPGRKVWPRQKSESEYGKLIVAIFNNLIYIQFSIYIYLLYGFVSQGLGTTKFMNLIG